MLADWTLPVAVFPEPLKEVELRQACLRYFGRFSAVSVRRAKTLVLQTHIEGVLMCWNIE